MLSSVGMVLGTVIVIAFFVSVLAFVAYALLRPFTHVHYHRSGDKLWRPLP
jgi:hypothetical protein